MTVQFPKGFEWGVATASYQIEGAVHEGGRGESIWDRFSHIEGNIQNGDTGDIACDHYHLYKDDVALMKELGVKTYRFSISWPRIFPNGTGDVNEEGVQFYRNLLEALHEAGIEPAVTLFHWDLPQKLQDKGGWLNRETADAFATYAKTCYERFGDLVPRWITHNEPFVHAFLGHYFGEMAPGMKDLRATLQVSHHLLLSHGMAVKVHRELGLQSEIGITYSTSSVYPANKHVKDKEAAELYDGMLNKWFFDPVLLGSYPEDIKSRYEEAFPLDFIQDGDLDTISQRIDFCGINYYFRTIIAYDNTVPFWNGREVQKEHAERTAMGWEVYPDGLRQRLLECKERYGNLPLYITENGCAADDVVNEGKVDDSFRISYLDRHFKAMQEAIEQDGVNLKGYYLWSFLDNFEWAYGYDKRFGIVYVDYETLQRVKKDSFYWYQQVVKENGLPSKSNYATLSCQS
ncbi:beta-glucosidase [Pontibacillus halophilus JSM 076056 = DSM 19796]|uniref:Beta-glucosidase n=1 Tax=Pontibacillus halophilus JSM 076056 = DSM 19796 TaxID=1385510 RepID=A0A0A5GRV1_9BACI|nr:GH1 family beta-glucosidase [Pontibacillus halophilus]KGX93968.1 beta-glucosidase [Pontibacillus halophilus JSM 076056 = DSM 19796]